MKPKFSKFTKLHHACVNGNFDAVVEAFTSQLINPDLKCGAYHLSPLHLASWQGSLKIVRYLIEVAAANPHILCDEGNHSLHYACLNDHASVVDYYSEIFSCNLNMRNKAGITPLMYAARTGSVLIFQKIFISKETLDNVVDNCGCTTLHHAVWGGNKIIIEKLMMLGADCNKLDNFGRNPFALCRSEEIKLFWKAKREGESTVAQISSMNVKNRPARVEKVNHDGQRESSPRVNLCQNLVLPIRHDDSSRRILSKDTLLHFPSDRNLEKYVPSTMSSNVYHSNHINFESGLEVNKSLDNKPLRSAKLPAPMPKSDLSVSTLPSPYNYDQRCSYNQASKIEKSVISSVTENFSVKEGSKFEVNDNCALDGIISQLSSPLPSTVNKPTSHQVKSAASRVNGSKGSKNNLSQRSHGESVAWQLPQKEWTNIANNILTIESSSNVEIISPLQGGVNSVDDLVDTNIETSNDTSNKTEKEETLYDGQSTCITSTVETVNNPFSVQLDYVQDRRKYIQLCVEKTYEGKNGANDINNLTPKVFPSESSSIRSIQTRTTINKEGFSKPRMIQKLKPSKILRVEKRLMGMLVSPTSDSPEDSKDIKNQIQGSNAVPTCAAHPKLENLMIRRQRLIRRAFELEVESGISFIDDDDDKSATMEAK